MAQLMLVNPKKRRKSRKAKARRRSPSRALASVTRKTIRRYRRNPIKKNDMVQTFTGGAIGAAGALAVDVAMAKLPIPANLTTGNLAPITKGFVGIGLGMLVSKVGKNKKLGEQLAGGAVTVALYNAGRQMIGPSLGLAGYDDGLLGWDDGLLGYYNAAPTSGGDYADYEMGEVYTTDDMF